MSGKSKSSTRSDSSVIEVKSKFDAEFRRFALGKDLQNPKFDEFYKTLEDMHRLANIPFLICYTDPNGDLLPINNDDNYKVALCTAKPMLRLLVQRKGESWGEINGYGTVGRPKKNPISKFMAAESKPSKPPIQISLPEDFRRVSAIIDVDIIPETHRRVKLMKNGTDKPLGFYIRDGTSLRVTPHGVEKVPGIFVSRLVPGGLAESTGLLAVNDEVLEVNGIEVMGKTLDQVTDMMVANSSNLIITVKPVNQRNNLSLKGETSTRSSQKSTTSLVSGQSVASNDSDEIRDFTQDDDEDEVRDLLANNNTTSSSKETNNSAEVSTGNTSTSPGSVVDQTVIEKDRQSSIKEKKTDSPVITL